MAAPKSRLNRSTPGTSPVPTSANPFASSFGAQSQPQQQQQSFQMPGGITFGENKSFPPGGAASGSGFSFAPQSSSFTFGQTTPNNPFATVNGNGDINGGQSEQNANNSEDAMMESPQKKPVFGGAFGNSVNGSTPFGGFGAQATQSPPQLNFGSSQPQSNGFGGSTSTGVFGQNQTDQGPTNLFAQSSPKPESTPSFGQTNGLFNKPNPVSSSFNFGQPAATASSPQSGFTFQPQSQPPSQPSASGVSFGQSSQSASAPNNALFSFGQQSTSSQPSVPATSSAGSSSSASTLFGSSQQKPVTNNLFGGFGTSKPVEAQKSETTETSSQPTQGGFWAGSSDSAPVSESTTPAKVNPFASLFGSNNKNDTEKVEASAPAADSQPSKSPFTFAAPSQPVGLFGSKPTNEIDSVTKTANETPSKPSFGFQSSQAVPASSMFTPSKPDANNASVGTLFGNSAKKARESESAPATSESSVSDTTSKKTTPAFSFGQTSTSKPTTTESQPLFGGFKPAPQTANANGPSAPEITPSSGIFGQISAPKSASNPGTISTETVVADSGSTGNAKLDNFDPKHAVSSNPPARVPAWLSGDKYKSYDSNYRLHSLNREFQKRIASLDPSKQDFENILRSYVAARESIGESIGLYTRNVAGMKRKTDTVDEQREEPPSAKRTRQSEPSISQSTVQSQSTSSIFQPVPASVPSNSNNMFGSSNTTTKAASPLKSFTPSNQNASSLFKSMIPEGNKASDSSADKPAGNPFASLMAKTAPVAAAATASPAFSFGKAASSAPKLSGTESTTPPSSPPKQAKPTAGGFKMPGFAAPATGTNFLSSFGQSAQKSAEKFAREAKEKRKAEEFDSDEDDEEEWNKKYEEEERAKREKIEAAKSKGFTPSFGAPSKLATSSDRPSASTGTANSDSSTKQSIEISDTEEQNEDASDEQESEGEDDLAEDQVVDDGAENEEDENETITLPPGQSLFNRITRDSTPQQDKDKQSTSKTSSSIPAFDFKSSVFGNNLAKSTPEAPAFSPITPSTNSAFVPAKTFSFTPPLKENPSPSPGASVFEGGIVRDGPIPGEGLFGSRSSTPVNGDKPTSNPFGGFGSSQPKTSLDQTWKKGSDIKFGTSTTDAPSVNITAPSPQPKETAKPFGSLFGAPSGASNSSSTPGSLGFSFGASTSTPAPGFLGASSHLVPNSATSSAMSSRATSPGGTDNESVATDNEDSQTDPQASLISSNPGEEDEDLLYEGRVKALKLYSEEEAEELKKTHPWHTEGVGPIRILKNRNTGKGRVVVRAEPNANIVMNFNLLPDVEYTTMSGSKIGAVKFIILNKDGRPESWTLRVKSPQVADEIADIMQKNKGKST